MIVAQIQPRRDRGLDTARSVTPPKLRAMIIFGRLGSPISGVGPAVASRAAGRLADRQRQIPSEDMWLLAGFSQF